MIEAPQTRRLRQRQLQPGHLDELTAHPMDKSLKIHARSLSNTRANTGIGCNVV